MANDRLPTGWASWPTIRGVAEQLECSQAEARRQVREFSVTSYKAPDGTSRFNPDDIQKLAAMVDEADETSDEPIGKQAKRERVAERIQFMRTQNEFMQLVLQHSREVQTQMVRLVEAVPTMIGEAQKLLVAASQRDGEQLSKFYESRESLFTAREEALNQAEERKAIAAQVHADEQRKQFAFEQLMKALPKLVTQIQSTIASNAKDPRVVAALDLLGSIDDASLAALMSEELEILQPEQRAKLKAVLGTERCEVIEKLRKAHENE